MSQFTSFIDGLPDLTQGVDPELQAALAAAQKNPRMAQAIKPSKWNNQETRSPLDILQAEAQSQAAPQGGKFDALIAGLPALPGAQPPEQTNALQAAVISGGRTMDRLAAGLRDATPAPVRDAVDWLNNKLGMGAPPSIDPAVQAANTKAYAPVAEQHPVASLVGSSIPLLAAASPLSMAGMGALEYGTPAERAMGAGAGFVGGKIGQGLGRLAGPETMRGVATDAGDFMNAAGNKWGIPTTVGQQPGASKTAQIAESVLANLPFGGAVNDARNASYQGFNRAVSKTFGQDTGTLTPEMFGQVLDQTGKQIGDVMGKARAKLSPAQAAEVADLSRVVADLGPEGHLLDKRLGTMIDGMTNGQTMSGQTLRMFDSSLGRLMGSDVGDVRYAAARMQNIVRDAAAASLPQAEQDALNLARRQNFNVRQVADAAKANPGSLSPSQLLTQVNAYQRKARFGGGNDLAELAQWGKTTLPDKIPNSGTAQRAYIQAMLTNPGKTLAGAGVLGGAGYAGSDYLSPWDASAALVPLLAARGLAGKPASELTKRLLMQGGGLLGLDAVNGQ